MLDRSEGKEYFLQAEALWQAVVGMFEKHQEGKYGWSK